MAHLLLSFPPKKLVAITYPTLTGPTAVQGSGNPSLSWVSGHVSGDIGFILKGIAGNETMSGPTGTTAVDNANSGSTSSAARARTAYKVASSGAEAAISMQDDGNLNQGSMILVHGASGTPTAHASANANGSSIAFTGISNAPANGTMLMSIFCYNGASGAVSAATTPSGWTITPGGFYAGSTAIPAYGGMVHYYKNVLSGQAISDVTVTLGGSYKNVGFLTFFQAP